MFSNLMIWDWHLAGSGKNSIEFTSDSRQCFLSFRGGFQDLVDNGLKNTIIDYESGEIKNYSLNSQNKIIEYIQVILVIFGLIIISLICSILYMKRKYHSK